MKKFYSSLLIAAVVTYAFIISAAPAYAQSPDTDAQKLDYVARNCFFAQTTLQRLQRSDVVVRTNRGRGYESVIKLTAALNSRLALNKISQPQMVEISSRLQNRFDAFKGDYISYQTTLGELLKIQSCSKNPAAFYQKVAQAREARTRLKDTVAEMRTLTDVYANRVNELQAGLQKTAVNGTKDER